MTIGGELKTTTLNTIRVNIDKNIEEIKAYKPEIPPDQVALNAAQELLKSSLNAEFRQYDKLPALMSFAPLSYGGVKEYLPMFDGMKMENLTKDAISPIFSTPYGDGRLFYDKFGDGDPEGIANFSHNAQLFNFDSNGDGIINSKDKAWDKLKIKAKDENGKEVILRLADVTDGVNLKDFIKQQKDQISSAKDIKNNFLPRLNEMRKKEGKEALDGKIDNRFYYNASNPATLLAPETRYHRVSDNQIKDFFDKYADNDGWVNLRDNNIFNDAAEFKNFAYEKLGFDGQMHLSEFNPISLKDGKSFFGNELDKNSEISAQASKEYTSHQLKEFRKFYDDYKEAAAAYEKDVAWISENLKIYNVPNADNLIKKLNESKSAMQIAMENAFTKATGLEFSEQNLRQVQRAFGKDANRAAAMLKDADSVIAMHRLENGQILLKFDSGRVIKVSGLYSDTGNLATSKGRTLRLNLELKTAPAKEFHHLKMEDFAIKFEDGGFKSLGELGVKSVQRLAGAFRLNLHNGKSLSAKEIYNIEEATRFLDPAASWHNNGAHTTFGASSVYSQNGAAKAGNLGLKRFFAGVDKLV